MATLDSAELQVQGELEMDQSLRHDLLDLAILSAKLEVQLSPADKLSASRESAKQRLDEARQLCGESPVLDVVERDYAAEPLLATTDFKSDSLPAAGNSWEHNAIGRWLMDHKLLTDAERRFAAAIDLKPDDFWAHFQQMRCNFELRNFDEALTSARECLDLSPHRTECFYNRAKCHESLGHNDSALVDYSRALKIDPNFAPAALAQGALLIRLQRFADANVALESALAHGGRPSDVYYQLARLNIAQNDTQAARKWLQKSLAEDPASSDSLTLAKQLDVGQP